MEKPMFRIVRVERTENCSSPILTATTQEYDGLRLRELKAHVDGDTTLDVLVSVVPQYHPEDAQRGDRWGYATWGHITTHRIRCGTSEAARAVCKHINTLPFSTRAAATRSITLLERIERMLPSEDVRVSAEPDRVDLETYLMRCEHLLEVLTERLDTYGRHKDGALAATALFLLQDARAEIGA